jgi:23S rRNA (adenine2503-C2)-methyltransferase
LSVSLHASNDELRSRLMPVNRKYRLNELMNACRTYASTTDRQVTFEYILIKGLTATPAAAEELGRLLGGWLCKINLIACNPVSEFSHQPPSEKEADDFRRSLEKRGIITTFRAARGRDIAGACGQLRHASIKGH